MLVQKLFLDFIDFQQIIKLKFNISNEKNEFNNFFLISFFNDFLDEFSAFELNKK